MTQVAVVANAEVRGGAEKYVVDLYRDLRRELPATLVGRIPGWHDAGLASLSVPVGPKWSRRNILQSAARAPQEARTMVEAVRGTGAPWTHLQYKREQILLTRSLAKTSEVLWTEHGTPYAGRGSSGLAAAYRFAASKVRTIVCVSADVGAPIRELVAGRTRVVVVDNPVDSRKFRPATSVEQREALRAKLFPAEWGSRWVAMVACRLHSAKRLERVIETAARSRLPLAIVGDGPDRARLEGLAKGHDVAFLGHRADIDDVMRAADIYLFSASTTGEGQPLAVLEAAASGLHVVGFTGDVGNALITRMGGAVVRPGIALTSTDLAPARGVDGREYVLRHHSREGWHAAYRAILAG